MIRQKLESFVDKTRCTLLGVGPMSQNVVDATIELANEHEIPLMLIASRRQIDSADFGGGYVNQWTTEDFARYVIDRDKKGKVILARDHGGPWQSPIEVSQNLSLRRAMDSAKTSYEADILAGFEIIHIDPSVDIHGTPSTDDVLERVFELYDYCWTVAKKNNRQIIFEIGTDEQSGSTNTLEELDYVLNKSLKFCRKNGFPEPMFVVIQTGTKVMETRNVGSFDSPFRIKGELAAEIQIPKLLDVCRHHNVCMKEHNADYLSEEALAWHPRLGIHASNVAPEFGVTETRAFMELMKIHGLKSLEEAFVELSFSSKKWEKWMLPNTEANAYDRAIIAGHYTFATAGFIELKEKVTRELQGKVDVDDFLKSRIKKSIFRYIKNFRMLR